MSLALLQDRVVDFRFGIRNRPVNFCSPRFYFSFSFSVFFSFFMTPKISTNQFSRLGQIGSWSLQSNQSWRDLNASNRSMFAGGDLLTLEHAGWMDPILAESMLAVIRWQNAAHHREWVSLFKWETWKECPFRDDGDNWRWIRVTIIGALSAQFLFLYQSSWKQTNKQKKQTKKQTTATKKQNKIKPSRI